MRTLLIIPLTPLFNNLLGLSAIGKDPAIQTFAAQRAIKTLDERVFPRTAGGDVERLALLIAQPVL